MVMCSTDWAKSTEKCSPIVEVSFAELLNLKDGAKSLVIKVVGRPQVAMSHVL